jgi:hypothetical protein
MGTTDMTSMMRLRMSLVTATLLILQIALALPARTAPIWEEPGFAGEQVFPADQILVSRGQRAVLVDPLTLRGLDDHPVYLFPGLKLVLRPDLGVAGPRSAMAQTETGLLVELDPRAVINFHDIRRLLSHGTTLVAFIAETSTFTAAIEGRDWPIGLSRSEMYPVVAVEGERAILEIDYCVKLRDAPGVCRLATGPTLLRASVHSSYLGIVDLRQLDLGDVPFRKLLRPSLVENIIGVEKSCRETLVREVTVGGRPRVNLDFYFVSLELNAGAEMRFAEELSGDYQARVRYYTRDDGWHRRFSVERSCPGADDWLAFYLPTHDLAVDTDGLAVIADSKLWERADIAVDRTTLRPFVSCPSQYWSLFNVLLDAGADEADLPFYLAEIAAWRDFRNETCRDPDDRQEVITVSVSS